MELFKIAWAEMPLEWEELRNIDPSHRVRPYLLCMDMDYFYYAFPCTSKIVYGGSRYENERVLLHGAIGDSSSLVNLGELSILPKENLQSNPHNVSERYNDEIIKKINACAKFDNYPEEFIRYFSALPYSCAVSDLVELDEQLYVIIGYKGKDYVGNKVYPYPVDDTAEISVDGLRYYATLTDSSVLDGDSITYRTHLRGYNSPLKNITHIRYPKDYSKFYNLEPGMIISYDNDGVPSKMIILENYAADVVVMAGREDERYCDFEPMDLSGDKEFEYRIVGYLNWDRTLKLIDIKDKKLEEKSKKKELGEI